MFHIKVMKIYVIFLIGAYIITVQESFDIKMEARKAKYHNNRGGNTRSCA